ncbi:hypothetical protein GIB67_031393 [Kingdonia uniflora]|uniref:Pentatricopeptide repeat-containing protein n=1 Tax=Kingdonia uniflora TaxID=39325 RepID=A0A7J7MB08_9MAGN|nr:hypothetical protein GIB67_031393 [Kingdonia uniflora]
MLVNSMIYGYAQSSCGEEVVRLFDQKQDSMIKPNDMTLLSVLFACSNGGLLEDGYQIFSSFKKNPKLELLIYHYSCMLDLLDRARKLEEAETLLTKVVNPNVVLWKTLLWNWADLTKLKVVINDMRTHLYLDLHLSSSVHSPKAHPYRHQFKSHLAWKDLSTETGRDEACKDIISTPLLREEAVAHFLNFHEHIAATGRALVLSGLQESEEEKYEAIVKKKIDENSSVFG